MREYPTPAENAYMVSIRARHCWRAMQPSSRPWHWKMNLFQSAPAIAGGRCLLCSGYQEVGSMFQSAPAIAGGRCTAISCYWMICHQFQSAPAIAGGRCAVSVRVFRGWRLVSIRARHCWRAMRCRGRGGRPSKFVSIRARHCWRAMRTINLTGFILTECFNPRPPLLAGDAMKCKMLPRAN